LAIARRKSLVFVQQSQVELRFVSDGHQQRHHLAEFQRVRVETDADFAAWEIYLRLPDPWQQSVEIFQ